MNKILATDTTKTTISFDHLKGSMTESGKRNDFIFRISLKMGIYLQMVLAARGHLFSKFNAKNS